MKSRGHWAWVLALVFLGLGSGGVEYAHNLQHAAEDAREDQITQNSGHAPESHHHDETNCAFHAQLHLPLAITAWVPPLIGLGLFVAFLPHLRAVIAPFSPRVRIDCRGPPAIAACL